MPLGSLGGGSFGGGGGTGGGSNMVSSAPQVDLRSPEADAVLTNVLSASCSVARGTADDANPVDPDTISIALLDPNEEEGEPVVEASAKPGEADEYVAELPLTEVPPGVYTARCSARDTSSEPTTGVSDSRVLVDHGPSIEPLSPIAEGFLSEAGQHEFVVRIRPQELFSGDEDAALDGQPVLSIDEHDFLLEALEEDEDNVYRVSEIDFEDTEIFSEPPPGQTIVSVKATNRRGITGQTDYPIFVDGEGPTISVASPESGSIVGSRATFSFQATDDYSGVDWTTLVVEAKDVEIPFDADSPRWSQSGDTAVLELTTTELSVATQMSVNVTVEDLAGNESNDGAESTYYLDQQPPLLSLDPPHLRVGVEKDEGPVCSHSYDPLGAAIDHGADTNNLALFRAFAWDLTNQEQGQITLHFSTVDTSSLRLWMAPAGEALVVDTTEDGICDNISSSHEDIDTVELTSLNPRGSVYFGAGTDDDALPPMEGVCDYSAQPEDEPPTPLCDGDSDLTYVTGQNLSAGLVPAVYASLVGDGPTCTGDQQSISALVGDVEGWICVAVRGYDIAGNRGVSAPLAVCLDNSEVEGQPSCWGAGPEEAPDCTDGCSPALFPSDGLIVEEN